MIILVLALALSHLRPALRLAGPARPVIGLQGRRVARAAARGRGAAPRPSAAPARLGRPRRSRRAGPAPADATASTPTRQSRHRPALAQSPGHPQVEPSAPGPVPVLLVLIVVPVRPAGQGLRSPSQSRVGQPGPGQKGLAGGWRQRPGPVPRPCPVAASDGGPRRETGCPSRGGSRCRNWSNWSGT